MNGRFLYALLLILCVVLPAFGNVVPRVSVSLSKLPEQTAQQEWSTTVAALLKLRLYDTGPAQVKSLMSGKALPVPARVSAAYAAQYSVLAYAVAADSAAPRVLLLFRQDHLICIGVIYGGAQESYSFICVYDDAWEKRHNYKSKSLNAVDAAPSTWEQQLLQLAKTGSKLTRKKARACMLRVPAVVGDSYSPLPQGKGCVHFYYNHADEEYDTPTSYFRHGDYLYMRYAAVAFDAAGKPLSFCHGLEIGHFQLPEDGSTDPLYLNQSYILLPQ